MSIEKIQKNKLKEIIKTVEYNNTTLGSLNAVIANTPSNFAINPLISITRSGLRIIPQTTEENECVALYRIRVFNKFLQNIVVTEDNLGELVTKIIEKFANDGSLYGNNDLTENDGTPWEYLEFPSISGIQALDENIFYIDISAQLTYTQPRIKNQS